MFKKFKSLIIVGITMLTMSAPMVVPSLISVAAADNSNVTGGLCGGIDTATGGAAAASSNSTDCVSNPAGSSTSGLYTLAANVVNIFSVIVGIVAVIMIIYGGFKYITSGGDSGNVSGAKNTLIYAIVGLIIVALAQFIVHYVLGTAASATGANA
jgi:hypothetical protein